jgi:hypothetical protein
MEKKPLEQLRDDHKAISESLMRAQGSLTELKEACVGLNKRLSRTSQFLIAGPQYQDVAIGFVIAAAASALVGMFPRAIADSGFFRAAILLSFMLLFLALTWISYVAIRGQLPQDERAPDQGQVDHYSMATNAAKFVVEFLASCLLAICCVMILDHASQFLPASGQAETTLGAGSKRPPVCNAAGAFGVFALLSQVWNLLALYAMKKLQYIPLVLTQA